MSSVIFPDAEISLLMPLKSLTTKGLREGTQKVPFGCPHFLRSSSGLDGFQISDFDKAFFSSVTSIFFLVLQCGHKIVLENGSRINLFIRQSVFKESFDVGCQGHVEKLK